MTKEKERASPQIDYDQRRRENGWCACYRLTTAEGVEMTLSETPTREYAELTLSSEGLALTARLSAAQYRCLNADVAYLIRTRLPDENTT